MAFTPIHEIRPGSIKKELCVNKTGESSGVSQVILRVSVLI